MSQAIHPRRFYIGTTAERGAFSPPSEAIGAQWWDTDLSSTYWWDGSAWTGVSVLTSPDGGTDPVLSADNSGNVTLAGTGTLTIPTDLIHAGDSDTKLSFTDDQWDLTVGGINMIRADETTQDVLFLGDVARSGDVNINMYTDKLFIRPTSDSVTSVQITDVNGGNPIFNVDSTNERLSVRTATNEYTRQGNLTGAQLYIEDDDVGNVRTAVFSRQSDTAGRSPTNSFIRSGASLTAIADTYFIGAFNFSGHDGTDYNTSCQFSAVVDGAVSANTVPMAFAIKTSETTGTALATRLYVAPDGKIGLNGITSPSTELDIGAGAMEFDEMTAPSAGAVNTGRVYFEDNGAGKTRMMVIFNTGAAQQLAIQP